MNRTSAVAGTHWAALTGPTGRQFRVLVGDEFDAVGTSLTNLAFRYSDGYALLFDLLHEGSTVIDVGAHIGTFALAAASMGCRVIAIEPAPRNVALLRASITANGFTNITLIEAAAAASRGRAAFRPDGAFGQITAGSNDEGTVLVDTAPIADIMHDLEVSQVDAVKVDVEGAELDALRGMATLLSAPGRPPLVVEGNDHTLRSLGHTPTDLLQMTEALGYRNYLIGDHELAPVNPESTQPRCVVDYLALTKGADRPAGWALRSQISPRELAAELLAELRTRDPHKIAFVERMIALSTPDLMGEWDARTAAAMLSLASSHTPRSDLYANELGHAELVEPARSASSLDASREEIVEIRARSRAFRYATVDLERERRARRSA